MHCFFPKILLSSFDRKTHRVGSQKVLPDALIRHSANRKSFPKSTVLKQGILDKQGNATVKVWKEYVKSSNDIFGDSCLKFYWHHQLLFLLF